jgi:hypothetical protein
MLKRWLDENLEFDFTISHIPGKLNVLPDCLSRMYAAPDRSFIGAAVGTNVLPLPVLPEMAPSSFGLPLLIWRDFVEDDVLVRRMLDWLPEAPVPLVGGRSVVLDPDTEWDLDYHSGFPQGVVPPAPDHPMVAAVARAAAASGRTDSGAGPVLDPLGKDLHLPFVLTKLGEHVKVTPEGDRAEALKWAHAQGHRGTRGTYHRLLAEGFKWPKMEKDCLRVAKECLDCQRFTAQRYGFHPLRSVTADLPMDGLAMDLAQMKTSEDGKTIHSGHRRLMYKVHLALPHNGQG